ncbi:hypothetical protein [Methanobrevibacter arboriphilus]|uniref:hypothetical protein n=1 Tax=Methanobrevibacter arboriphilus TaxID=39441 RepID=UPI000AC7400D|nr:hypothetical protein [Methanobrevibacter arboriphilus]
MLNKKSQWEFDYNLQIGVDDFKGIMLSIGISNNPTDFNELIPQIIQIEENIGELPKKILKFQLIMGILQTKIWNI